VPLDYDRIKNWRFEPVRQELTSREVILYALAVGFGHEPHDRRALRFVYEKSLLAAPSLATVLAPAEGWMRYPSAGIDWKRAESVSQRLVMHSPLPVSGTVVGRTQVSAVVDLGETEGALVVEERRLADKAGRPLATLELTSLCRGDGGLRKSDEVPVPPFPAPDRSPDVYFDIPTHVSAGLLYRLTGDLNPLHADPDAAIAAGLTRPTLSSFCLFGMACHALIRTWSDYDPHTLRMMSAQFGAAAYPGETIRTEMWRREGEVAFQVRSLERNEVVLSHGAAKLVASR